MRFHPLTTMSIGAIDAQARLCQRPEDVAKRQARLRDLALNRLD